MENKRGYGCSQDDHEPKRQKLPPLASVIVEAVKVDSLQILCSSLEPLFRKIVSEEVERALSRLEHPKLPARSSPQKIQGPNGRNLQLHFKTRMPPHLFTGGKVEGEQGAAIHVVLLDTITGSVIHSGPESVAKLSVVVLEGDFNEQVEEDWDEELFETNLVTEREGKRPLLTGDVHVTLKEGVGTLGDLTFTDNSSWIRSRKFRLGVKISTGYCEGIRIREAKTEAFAVKDHRGELYKKHYPPALHDEVWRLDRIAKDGALHKKLLKADIVIVEDFLRVLVSDPQRLRNILGSGMSNRMWENTVEHAKTCVLGGKLCVYYTDETHSTGVVFSHTYELRGLIAEGQFYTLESLSNNQKISVDLLVKKAYENWHHVVEYDGKVLNCLSSSKKEAKSSITSEFESKNNKDPFVVSNQIQNRQQHVSSLPPRQCETENKHQPVVVPQLIEFPFVRSDHTIMAQTSQLAALPSSIDYMSVGSSYYAGEWNRLEKNNGEDMFAEEIRVRSSEMLESDDMQRLLKTFNVGFGESDEACYSYNIPYETQLDTKSGQRGRGKAVVGWLKLKAALRWGIFTRKRAAQKRAQLVELD